MGAISFQELVHRANLTPQQMSSKSMQQLLDVALDDQIDSVKTATSECDEISKRYQDFETKSFSARADIEELERDLSAIDRRIKAQSEFIDDKPTRTGVMAYREILKATVDVFGEENMTESVICKAIEEAGFAAWRSIMGPKVDGARR